MSAGPTSGGESRARRARAFARLALLGVAAGCGSFDEVGRVATPDGAVDAVLVERNGGATTSFGYDVFVVPHGRGVMRVGRGAVATLYGAGRNDSAYGATLRWVTPTSLAVEYQDARRAAVVDSVVSVAGRRVRVALRPGVTDPAAPAGGMLWNLDGRRPPAEPR